MGVFAYGLSSVAALSMIAGLAQTANNDAAALGLAKNLTGTQILVTKYYGGAYGVGSLDAALIADQNIIPADWTTSGNAIKGQGGTTITFDGQGATFTATVAGMNQDLCAHVLTSSSGAQWSSVSISGVVIHTWPISKSTASGACHDASSGGLSAVFRSI